MPTTVIETFKPGIVHEAGEALIRYDAGVGHLPGQFAVHVAGEAIGWASSLSDALEIADRRLARLTAARDAMDAIPEFTATERDQGVALAVILNPGDPELVAEVGQAYVQQMPADARGELWRAVSQRFAFARWHLVGSPAPSSDQVAASLRQPWMKEAGHDD